MAVKTEVQTVRMTPRIKYAATIAARHQHITLSSFIEEAIEEKARKVEHYEFGVKSLLGDIVDEIWFPVESARFCFLADRLPSLLTDEEKVLWQLIQGDNSLWYTGPGGELMSRDNTAKNGIKFDVLEKKWPSLQAKAKAMLS